jgi:hypothetical protein
MIPATAVAMRAAQQFPGEVEVKHPNALGPEAQPYGLMVTPFDCHRRGLRKRVTPCKPAGISPKAGGCRPYGQPSSPPFYS